VNATESSSSSQSSSSPSSWKAPARLTGSKTVKLKQGPGIECGKSKPTEGHLEGGGKSGLVGNCNGDPSAGAGAGAGKPTKRAEHVLLFVVDDLQPDGVSSFKVRNRPSSGRKVNGEDGVVCVCSCEDDRQTLHRSGVAVCFPRS
jgi:hypothetical protein